MFAEDHRGETEDIRILIFPASGAEPRLDAGLFEEGLPVPFLLPEPAAEEALL